MCSIFNDIGLLRFDFKLPLNKFARPGKRLQQHLTNLENLRTILGFTFYCASDQFISIAIAQVLQMPSIWPVYVRERSSRMYGELPYFFATWSASTLNLIIFQPLIYATATFCYLNLDNSSYENYQTWLLILTIQGINGSTFGFMFGCLIVEPIMCLMIAYFFLVLIYFGGGAFINYQGNENMAQSFFNTISPFRYSAELMLSTIFSENQDRDYILDNLSYTARENCWRNLLIFFLTLFSVSYAGLKLRSLWL